MNKNNGTNINGREGLSRWPLVFMIATHRWGKLSHCPDFPKLTCDDKTFVVIQHLSKEP